jgi:hypothetical protein
MNFCGNVNIAGNVSDVIGMHDEWIEWMLMGVYNNA